MTPNEQAKGKELQSNNVGWRSSVAVRYALYALLVLMVYFSLAPKLLPERYDIQVGMPSEKQILAPMEIPDTKATLKAQEEAADRVGESLVLFHYAMKI